MKIIPGRLFCPEKPFSVMLIIALLATGCTLPAVEIQATAIPQLIFPTALASVTPNVALATEILPPPTLALPTSLPTTSVPLTEVPPTIENPSQVPPTAVPPTAIQPTALPSPTLIPTSIPTSIPGAIRVVFAKGATAGNLQGQLQPGQVQNFLVRAAEGQPLMVSVTSPKMDVTLSVAGLKDGKTLLYASKKLSSWQTMLTTTQDYLIQVIAGAVVENFSLSIITPARIRFAPGAVSASLTGSTPGGLTVSYILRASAGQKMKLLLAAPYNNAVLSVYGYQDGQPFLRSVVEATTFDMTLPATEDYIVQVVPRGGEVASYTLYVEIK